MDFHTMTLPDNHGGHHLIKLFKLSLTSYAFITENLYASNVNALSLSDYDLHSLRRLLENAASECPPMGDAFQFIDRDDNAMCRIELTHNQNGMTRLTFTRQVSTGLFDRIFRPKPHWVSPYYEMTLTDEDLRQLADFVTDYAKEHA